MWSTGARQWHSTVWPVNHPLPIEICFYILYINCTQLRAILPWWCIFRIYRKAHNKRLTDVRGFAVVAPVYHRSPQELLDVLWWVRSSVDHIVPELRIRNFFFIQIILRRYVMHVLLNYFVFAKLFGWNKSLTNIVVDIAIGRFHLGHWMQSCAVVEQWLVLNKSVPVPK